MRRNPTIYENVYAITSAIGNAIVSAIPKFGLFFIRNGSVSPDVTYTRSGTGYSIGADGSSVAVAQDVPMYSLAAGGGESTNKVPDSSAPAEWELDGGATYDGDVFTLPAYSGMLFVNETPSISSNTMTARVLIDLVAGSDDLKFAIRRGTVDSDISITASDTYNLTNSLGGGATKTQLLIENLGLQTVQLRASQPQLNISSSILDYEATLNGEKIVTSTPRRYLSYAGTNEALSSNDFSNIWSPTNTASVTGENTLNFPAVGDAVQQIMLSGTSVFGDTYSGGVVLSGSGTVTLRIIRFTGTSEFTDETVTLTTTPTLYSVSHTFVNADTAGVVFQVRRNFGDTATQCTAEKARVNIGRELLPYIPTSGAAVTVNQPYNSLLAKDVIGETSRKPWVKDGTPYGLEGLLNGVAGANATGTFILENFTPFEIGTEQAILTDSAGTTNIAWIDTSGYLNLTDGTNTAQSDAALVQGTEVEQIIFAWDDDEMSVTVDGTTGTVTAFTGSLPATGDRLRIAYLNPELFTCENAYFDDK